MNENPLSIAIKKIGLQPLAASLGISYQAIRKWERANRMPRTEWTGDTNYSEQIEALTDRAVTKDQLLTMHRMSFEKDKAAA